MPASSSDKFGKASSGSRPEPTTLTASKSVAATSISCAALNGWATDTAVHFVIYTTDTDGNKVAGSQIDCKGIVSGTTITNITYRAGTDAVFPIGATVVATPTGAWDDDLMDGLLVQHNQDGTHGAITSTGATLTTPKVVTSVNDTNDNELLKITATASAVNELTLANAATGNNPVLSATGGDTNIGITLTPKGTGVVTIANTTGLGGAWTAYTPVIGAGGGSPTVGNGTITGWYTQIGKTVHFYINLTNGTTTNLGSGTTTFTLPVASSSNFPARLPMATGELLDASPAGSYLLLGIPSGTDKVQIQTNAVSGIYVGFGAFHNTSPITQATGDKTVIFGTYEAA